VNVGIQVARETLWKNSVRRRLLVFGVRVEHSVIEHPVAQTRSRWAWWNFIAGREDGSRLRANAPSCAETGTRAHPRYWCLSIR
jgi:hypothetical protein